MDLKAHWDAVYERNSPTGVSWYQPRLSVPLRLLVSAGLQPGSRVIDIGGGASTLVDDLLELGVEQVTVLDVSPRALEAAKARLGERASRVTWLVADITREELPAAAYDLWHDRAVFHFLTGAEDRRRYAAAMRRALKPDGQAVIATFAPQGPPRCSGLEVVRYSPESLQAELGGGLRLLESLEEDHRTPAGASQAFIVCRLLAGALSAPR
ncbi:MAG TPA: class I SAM-dependent methyltransferase [bacterium]